MLMPRWSSLLIAGLAVVLLWPTSLLAQDSEPTVEALRETLARLDAELVARQAETGPRLTQLRAEIALEKDKQKQLATRLLDADLRRHALLEAKDKLTTERDELSREHEAMSPTIAGALSAARSGGEQLQIHLSELPGEDANVDEVARLVATLAAPKAADDQHSPPAPEAAVASLMRLTDRVLAGANMVTLAEVEIWTAREQREKVELLRIGHIAFAYHTLADGRLGIALSSPADATGFRWTEKLNAALQADLAAAFDATASAGSSSDALLTLAAPMDVTGRLQPETLAGQKTLIDHVREGGLVMLPLAIVALLALLLILERAWVLYGRNSNAGALADRVVDAALRGDFDEAVRLCESRPGAVVHTLAACLRRRTKGQAAMEDSVQAQLLSELPRLQRFMGGIAILAGVAPLLGLLGTVTGIIQTFGVIRAFGNANPSLMAGGISEALITTAAGLVIAVPILLIHGLLSGRVDRIISNAEKYAANLLAVLAHDVPNGTGEAADDATAAAPAAAAASKPDAGSEVGDG